MSRLVSILFALALLVLLVILIDPNARQKATALVNSWQPTLEKLDDTIIVNTPSVRVSEQAATPEPTFTVTPVPTELVDNDDEELIPTTGGDEEVENEPFIEIHWDAFQAAVNRFWNDLREELQSIRINFEINDTK